MLGKSGNYSGAYVRIIRHKRKITQTVPPVNNESPSLGNFSGIKIAHSNVNSLRHKVDYITSELSDYDIICISESKLNDSISDSSISIDGYRQPLRKDRPINNGGGLVIYMKNNIHYKRRSDLELPNIETIWVEINALNRKFLLGLFYRPPNSSVDFWFSLENILENAVDHNLDLIILGDFNYDIIKNSNARNSHLQRIMTRFNLQHLITEPTRITNTTETCIDLIMTNHNSIINNTSVLPPFISDHCTVTAEVVFKTFKPLSYKKILWKYEGSNLQAIENDLISQDWSFIQTNDDINFINEQFNEILLNTANRHIPKVTFTVRPNDKPWMSNNLRKNMRQRNRLYQKAKISNSSLHWHKYKQKRNEVVELVRQAKSNYMQKLQNILANPKTSSKKMASNCKWHNKTEEKRKSTSSTSGK